MNYYIRRELIEDSRKAWRAGHPPETHDSKTSLSPVNESKED